MSKITSQDNMKEYYEDITLNESLKNTVNKIISIVEKYIVENKDKIKNELLENCKKMVDKHDYWSDSDVTISMIIECHDVLEKALSETILDKYIITNYYFDEIFKSDEIINQIYKVFGSNRMKIDFSVKVSKEKLYYIVLSFDMSHLLGHNINYYDNDITTELFNSLITLYSNDEAFRYIRNIITKIDYNNICDSIYRDIYHQYICRGISPNNCEYRFEIIFDDDHIKITNKTYMRYFPNYIKSLFNTNIIRCSEREAIDNGMRIKLYFANDLLENTFKGTDPLAMKLNRLFCNIDNNTICDDCINNKNYNIDKKYNIQIKKNNNTDIIRKYIEKNDADNLAKEHNSFILNLYHHTILSDDESYIVLSKTIFQSVINNIVAKKNEIKKGIIDNLTHMIIENQMFGENVKNDSSEKIKFENSTRISSLPINAYYIENINYSLKTYDGIYDYYETRYDTSFVVLDDEMNRYINNILAIGDNSGIKYMVRKPYINVVAYLHDEDRKIEGELCVLLDNNTNISILNPKNDFDRSIIDIVNNNYETIIKHRDILVKEYLNVICKHIKDNKTKDMYKLQMSRIRKIRELYVTKHIKPNLPSNIDDDKKPIEYLMSKALIEDCPSHYLRSSYILESCMKIITDGDKKYYKYTKDTKNKKNANLLPSSYEVSIGEVIKRVKIRNIIKIDVNIFALKLLSDKKFMNKNIIKVMNKKIGTQDYGFEIFNIYQFGKTNLVVETENNSDEPILPYSFNDDYIVRIFPCETELIDKIRIDN